MEPFSLEEHIAPKLLRAFSLGTLQTDESHRVSDHLAFCPSCRIAFVETMKTIEIPDSGTPQEGLPSIRGYHSLERIAYGGMGVVYLAVDSKSGQKVAIKRIIQRSSDAYGSDCKRRLVREAQTLLQLNHPNIVRAIEVVCQEDSPALVMEHIPGQGLHRWIREHQPDVPMIAKAILELADAVSYAHRHGVIHCDLKPQNVLVTQTSPGWRFKIIDFGLSKLVHENWDITQSGDVLGTPAYLAPEQTTGKSIGADPAIDVYGLGTILYQMLTGNPPFDATDSANLLAKIACQRPDRPRKIRPEVPVALERICMKCLEKQPAERYDSAQSLARDVQAFLTDQPIAAREAGLVKQVRRWVQGHLAIFSASLTTIAISLATAAWIWHESLTKTQLQTTVNQAQAQKVDAEARAYEAQESALDELRTSLVETTERLFGTTPEKEDQEWEALDRLAKRWSRYADRMDDQLTSQLVRAEAIMRVGSVQMMLGDLSLAEDKLRSALEVIPPASLALQQESNRLAIQSETYWQLAKCLFDAGKSIESDQAFQRAISTTHEANLASSGDLKHQLLRPKILCDYGTMLTRLSRIQEAQNRLNESILILESLEKSTSILTVPQIHVSLRTEILTQLWASKNALARVLILRGNAAEAAEQLEKSALQLRELEKQQPDNLVIQRLISIQQTLLGMSRLSLGRFELSKTSFLDAHTYQKKLLNLYPRRQDLMRTQGSLLGSLAVVSTRLGQTDDALRFIDESLQIHSLLVLRYPDRPEFLAEKAKSLNNLVAILASVYRDQEARQIGSELIEIQLQLVNQHPEQVEYIYNFAVSLNVVATVLARLGENAQAYVFFDQSQTMFQELIERFPNVASYRSSLAISCLSKGDRAKLNGDWRDAIEAYAITIETIHSFKPNSLQAESILLSKAYLGQASVYMRLGFIAESKACAQLGAEVVKAWKDNPPEVQELFRACSELANGSRN